MNTGCMIGNEQQSYAAILCTTTNPVRTGPCPDGTRPSQIYLLGMDSQNRVCFVGYDTGT
ncbi:hypothetical protein FOXG_20217 [Fusarium oxysporum f. sp. lycopersici 4287]|uniref:Uncharacterized protein n=2 Tax=Fusarium oxysporum TaxID=5507 RepID=A0A0J9VES5_FUSO4|nr:hypothetical protein FOXG_20217 [Fusarium oxysporum f. sp. lycopersici 4287]EXK24923.1 hypothetical protein FOMG_18383 [Fusarium oxysporum f. sp. melonis 26406]KNB09518.1 hypothetical protein FOXG_20217 [Fusarium oxysporum f. sp. lycopersici 4287]